MNYEKIIFDKIDKKYDVYKFLKENNFSEHYIRNLRKERGFILVNKQISTTRTALNYGDIVEIERNPFTKSRIKPCIIPLDIVFEDDYYLVVNKPANLSCIPTKSHYDNNLGGAICNYMKDKDKNFNLRIVGRLDKDTSGIIIVAKTSVACQKISEIHKTYHAICLGNVKKQTIDKPIYTINNNGKNELKRIISDLGKPAKTHVFPIKNFSNYTLCEINLEQGRTHQIRLHLSSIEHPLLGDELYGSKSELINHTALLCKKVSFYHYAKNEIITLEVPYPEDFEYCFKELD